jgi:hypothetical protein
VIAATVLIRKGRIVRTKLARLGLAAFLSLAGSHAAWSAWQNSGNPNEAVISVGSAELKIFCSGDLAGLRYQVGYAGLHAEIRDRPSIHLHFMLDQDRSGSGRALSMSLQPMRMGESLVFMTRGPGALELARTFGRARQSIHVGLSDQPAGASEYKKYNDVKFSAAGSSKAIRDVLEGCGLTY